MNLLNETRLTIGEVGQRVGFTEPAVFSRAFRQWTGISSYGYRQGLSGWATIPLPVAVGFGTLIPQDYFSVNQEDCFALFEPSLT